MDSSQLCAWARLVLVQDADHPAYPQLEQEGVQGLEALLTILQDRHGVVLPKGPFIAAVDISLGCQATLLLVEQHLQALTGPQQAQHQQQQQQRPRHQTGTPGSSQTHPWQHSSWDTPLLQHGPRQQQQQQQQTSSSLTAQALGASGLPPGPGSPFRGWAVPDQSSSQQASPSRWPVFQSGAQQSVQAYQHSAAASNDQHPQQQQYLQHSSGGPRAGASVGGPAGSPDSSGSCAATIASTASPGYSPTPAGPAAAGLQATQGGAWGQAGTYDAGAAAVRRSVLAEERQGHSSPWQHPGHTSRGWATSSYMGSAATPPASAVAAGGGGGEYQGYAGATPHSSTWAMESTPLQSPGGSSSVRWDAPGSSAAAAVAGGLHGREAQFGHGMWSPHSSFAGSPPLSSQLLQRLGDGLSASLHSTPDSSSMSWQRPSRHGAMAPGTAAAASPLREQQPGPRSSVCASATMVIPVTRTPSDARRSVSHLAPPASGMHHVAPQLLEHPWEAEEVASQQHHPQQQQQLPVADLHHHQLQPLTSGPSWGSHQLSGQPSLVDPLSGPLEQATSSSSRAWQGLATDAGSVRSGGSSSRALQPWQAAAAPQQQQVGSGALGASVNPLKPPGSMTEEDLQCLRVDIDLEKVVKSPCKIRLEIQHDQTTNTWGPVGGARKGPMPAAAAAAAGAGMDARLGTAGSSSTYHDQLQRLQQYPAGLLTAPSLSGASALSTISSAEDLVRLGAAAAAGAAGGGGHLGAAGTAGLTQPSRYGPVVLPGMPAAAQSAPSDFSASLLAGSPPGTAWDVLQANLRASRDQQQQQQQRRQVPPQVLVVVPEPHSASAAASPLMSHNTAAAAAGGGGRHRRSLSGLSSVSSQRPRRQALFGDWSAVLLDLQPAVQEVAAPVAQHAARTAEQVASAAVASLAAAAAAVLGPTPVGLQAAADVGDGNQQVSHRAAPVAVDVRPVPEGMMELAAGGGVSLTQTGAAAGAGAAPPPAPPASCGDAPVLWQPQPQAPAVEAAPPQAPVPAPAPALATGIQKVLQEGVAQAQAAVPAVLAASSTGVMPVQQQQEPHKPVAAAAAPAPAAVAAASRPAHQGSAAASSPDTAVRQQQQQPVAGVCGPGVQTAPLPGRIIQEQAPGDRVHGLLEGTTADGSVSRTSGAQPGALTAGVQLGAATLAVPAAGGPGGGPSHHPSPALSAEQQQQMEPLLHAVDPGVAFAVPLGVQQGPPQEVLQAATPVVQQQQQQAPMHAPAHKQQQQHMPAALEGLVDQHSQPQQEEAHRVAALQHQLVLVQEQLAALQQQGPALLASIMAQQRQQQEQLLQQLAAQQQQQQQQRPPAEAQRPVQPHAVAEGSSIMHQQQQHLPGAVRPEDGDPGPARLSSSSGSTSGAASRPGAAAAVQHAQAAAAGTPVTPGVSGAAATAAMAALSPASQPLSAARLLQHRLQLGRASPVAAVHVPPGTSSGSTSVATPGTSCSMSSWVRASVGRLSVASGAGEAAGVDSPAAAAGGPHPAHGVAAVSGSTGVIHGSRAPAPVMPPTPAVGAASGGGSSSSSSRVPVAEFAIQVGTHPPAAAAAAGGSGHPGGASQQRVVPGASGELLQQQEGSAPTSGTPGAGTDTTGSRSTEMPLLAQSGSVSPLIGAFTTPGSTSPAGRPSSSSSRRGKRRRGSSEALHRPITGRMSSGAAMDTAPTAVAAIGTSHLDPAAPESCDGTGATSNIAPAAASAVEAAAAGPAALVGGSADPGTGPRMLLASSFTTPPPSKGPRYDPDGLPSLLDSATPAVAGAMGLLGTPIAFPSLSPELPSRPPQVQAAQSSRLAAAMAAPTAGLGCAVQPGDAQAAGRGTAPQPAVAAAAVAVGSTQPMVVLSDMRQQPVLGGSLEQEQRQQGGVPDAGAAGCSASAAGLRREAPLAVSAGISPTPPAARSPYLPPAVSGLLSSQTSADAPASVAADGLSRSPSSTAAADSAANEAGSVLRHGPTSGPAPLQAPTTTSSSSSGSGKEPPAAVMAPVQAEVQTMSQQQQQQGEEVCMHPMQNSAGEAPLQAAAGTSATAATAVAKAVSIEAGTAAAASIAAAAAGAAVHVPGAAAAVTMASPMPGAGVAVPSAAPDAAAATAAAAAALPVWGHPAASLDLLPLLLAGLGSDPLRSSLLPASWLTGPSAAAPATSAGGAAAVEQAPAAVGASIEAGSATAAPAGSTHHLPQVQQQQQPTGTASSSAGGFVRRAVVQLEEQLAALEALQPTPVKGWRPEPAAAAPAAAGAVATTPAALRAPAGAAAVRDTAAGVEVLGEDQGPPAGLGGGSGAEGHSSSSGSSSVAPGAGAVAAEPESEDLFEGQEQYRPAGAAMMQQVQAAPASQQQQQQMVQAGSAPSAALASGAVPEAVVLLQQLLAALDPQKLQAALALLQQLPLAGGPVPPAAAAGGGAGGSSAVAAAAAGTQAASAALGAPGHQGRLEAAAVAGQALHDPPTHRQGVDAEWPGVEQGIVPSYPLVPCNTPYNTPAAAVRPAATAAAAVAQEPTHRPSGAPGQLTVLGVQPLELGQAAISSSRNDSSSSSSGMESGARSRPANAHSEVTSGTTAAAAGGLGDAFVTPVADHHRRPLLGDYDIMSHPISSLTSDAQLVTPLQGQPSPTKGTGAAAAAASSTTPSAAMAAAAAAAAWQMQRVSLASPATWQGMLGGLEGAPEWDVSESELQLMAAALQDPSFCSQHGDTAAEGDQAPVKGGGRTAEAAAGTPGEHQAEQEEEEEEEEQLPDAYPVWHGGSPCRQSRAAAAEAQDSNRAQQQQQWQGQNTQEEEADIYARGGASSSSSGQSAAAAAEVVQGFGDLLCSLPGTPVMVAPPTTPSSAAAVAVAAAVVQQDKQAPCPATRLSQEEEEEVGVGPPPSPAGAVGAAHLQQQQQQQATAPAAATSEAAMAVLLHGAAVQASMAAPPGALAAAIAAAAAAGLPVNMSLPSQPLAWPGQLRAAPAAPTAAGSAGAAAAAARPDVATEAALGGVVLEGGGDPLLQLLLEGAESSYFGGDPDAYDQVQVGVQQQEQQHQQEQHTQQVLEAPHHHEQQHQQQQQYLVPRERQQQQQQQQGWEQHRGMSHMPGMAYVPQAAAAQARTTRHTEQLQQQQQQPPWQPPQDVLMADASLASVAATEPGSPDEVRWWVPSQAGMYGAGGEAAAGCSSPSDAEQQEGQPAQNAADEPPLAGLAPQALQQQQQQVWAPQGVMQQAWAPRAPPEHQPEPGIRATHQEQQAPAACAEEQQQLGGLLPPPQWLAAVVALCLTTTRSLTAGQAAPQAGSIGTTTSSGTSSTSHAAVVVEAEEGREQQAALLDRVTADAPPATDGLDRHTSATSSGTGLPSKSRTPTPAAEAAAAGAGAGSPASSVGAGPALLVSAAGTQTEGPGAAASPVQPAAGGAGGGPLPSEARGLGTSSRLRRRRIRYRTQQQQQRTQTQPRYTPLLQLQLSLMQQQVQLLSEAQSRGASAAGPALLLALMQLLQQQQVAQVEHGYTQQPPGVERREHDQQGRMRWHADHHHQQQQQVGGHDRSNWRELTLSVSPMLTPEISGSSWSLSPAAHTMSCPDLFPGQQYSSSQGTGLGAGAGQHHHHQQQQQQQVVRQYTVLHQGSSSAAGEGLSYQLSQQQQKGHGPWAEGAVQHVDFTTSSGWPQGRAMAGAPAAAGASAAGAGGGEGVAYWQQYLVLHEESPSPEDRCRAVPPPAMQQQQLLLQLSPIKASEAQGVDVAGGGSQLLQQQLRAAVDGNSSRRDSSDSGSGLGPHGEQQQRQKEPSQAPPTAATAAAATGTVAAEVPTDAADSSGRSSSAAGMSSAPHVLAPSQPDALASSSTSDLKDLLSVLSLHSEPGVRSELSTEVAVAAAPQQPLSPPPAAGGGGRGGAGASTVQGSLSEDAWPRPRVSEQEGAGLRAPRAPLRAMRTECSQEQVVWQLAGTAGADVAAPSSEQEGSLEGSPGVSVEVAGSIQVGEVAGNGEADSLQMQQGAGSSKAPSPLPDAHTSYMLAAKPTAAAAAEPSGVVESAGAELKGGSSWEWPDGRPQVELRARQVHTQAAAQEVEAGGFPMHPLGGAHKQTVDSSGHGSSSISSVYTDDLLMAGSSSRRSGAVQGRLDQQQQEGLGAVSLSADTFHVWSAMPAAPTAAAPLAGAASISRVQGMSYSLQHAPPSPPSAAEASTQVDHAAEAEGVTGASVLPLFHTPWQARIQHLLQEADQLTGGPPQQLQHAQHSPGRQQQLLQGVLGVGDPSRSSSRGSCSIGQHNSRCRSRAAGVEAQPLLYQQQQQAAEGLPHSSRTSLQALLRRSLEFGDTSRSSSALHPGELPPRPASAAALAAAAAARAVAASAARHLRLFAADSVALAEHPGDVPAAAAAGGGGVGPAVHAAAGSKLAALKQLQAAKGRAAGAGAPAAGGAAAAAGGGGHPPGVPAQQQQPAWKPAPARSMSAPRSQRPFTAAPIKAAVKRALGPAVRVLVQPQPSAQPMALAPAAATIRQQRGVSRGPGTAGVPTTTATFSSNSSGGGGGGWSALRSASAPRLRPSSSTSQRHDQQQQQQLLLQKGVSVGGQQQQQQAPSATLSKLLQLKQQRWQQLRLRQPLLGAVAAEGSRSAQAAAAAAAIEGAANTAAGASAQVNAQQQQQQQHLALALMPQAALVTGAGDEAGATVSPDGAATAEQGRWAMAQQLPAAAAERDLQQQQQQQQQQGQPAIAASDPRATPAGTLSVPVTPGAAAAAGAASHSEEAAAGGGMHLVVSEAGAASLPAGPPSAAAAAGQLEAGGRSLRAGGGTRRRAVAAPTPAVAAAVVSVELPAGMVDCRYRPRLYAVKGTAPQHQQQQQPKAGSKSTACTAASGGAAAVAGVGGSVGTAGRSRSRGRVRYGSQDRSSSRTPSPARHPSASPEPAAAGAPDVPHLRQQSRPGLQLHVSPALGDPGVTTAALVTPSSRPVAKAREQQRPRGAAGGVAAAGHNVPAAHALGPAGQVQGTKPGPVRWPGTETAAAAAAAAAAGSDKATTSSRSRGLSTPGSSGRPVLSQVAAPSAVGEGIPKQQQQRQQQQQRWVPGDSSSPFGEDGRTAVGMAAAAAAVATAAGCSSREVGAAQWQDMKAWLGRQGVQLAPGQTCAPLLVNPLTNGALYCQLAGALAGQPVSGWVEAPQHAAAARCNVLQALVHLGLVGQQCGAAAVAAAATANGSSSSGGRPQCQTGDWWRQVPGSPQEQQVLVLVERVVQGGGAAVWGLLHGLRTHFDR